MKKRIIAFIAAISMIASVAYAEETSTNEEIMLISQNPQQEVVPSYISNHVTVLNIEDGRVETTTDETKKDDPEYIINFVVSEDTVAFDGNTAQVKNVSDIKVGDKLMVFTDSSSPATLSLPPVYMANIIVSYGSDEPLMSVVADTFNKAEEELVSLGNTLRVALSEETKVVDAQGNAVETADLSGKKLVVFYDMATRSLPPLTTPKFVIVLNETQVEEAVDFSSVTTIKAGENTISKIIVKEDGTVMIPVRAVAEGLGLKVEWNDSLKAVMINDGMFSFQIGVNSYIKGRMMPVELNRAPELVIDLTYVPVEFFTEIIGAKASVAEGTLVFTVE